MNNSKMKRKKKQENQVMGIITTISNATVEQLALFVSHSGSLRSKSRSKNGCTD
jgi:hypothetical protein